MVPWLAEISWIKIIVFTYICGYVCVCMCVCVYMNDGPYVWVFAFIKSALSFFLRFWRQRVALMKECRKPFFFGLSVARS